MEIYSDIIKYIEKKRSALDLEVLDKSNANLGVYKPTKDMLLSKCNEISKFSQRYGATLTLKKKYHNDDPLYLHRLVEQKIRKSTLWNHSKYILFAEFTRQGILHYHCIIWDMYEIQYVNLMNWWRRIFGYVKMEKEIVHYNCWIKYITKDYGKTGLWTIYKTK